MPVILGPTRRQWLKMAAGGACALAANAKDRTSRWALLSDTHVSAERDGEVRGFRPFDNIRNCVAKIESMPLDGCLIAGDLARLQGTPGDYLQLKSAIEPLTRNLPVAFCMGNHDDRDNFITAFAASEIGQVQRVGGKHIVVVERTPVRMVLLDSLIVTNETPGYLGKAQRTWLEKHLESTDATPTLLIVHHTLDDEDSSLLDSDRLLRIAAKYPKVKAIFYGHSHRYGYGSYEGVHLINLPAVGYNFSDNQPVGWVESTFSSSGAELTLRAIGGNTAENGKTRSLQWRT